MKLTKHDTMIAVIEANRDLLNPRHLFVQLSLSCSCLANIMSD